MSNVVTLDVPVAHLITLIGSEQFSPEFFKIISAMVPLDQCTVFVWDKDGISNVVAHAHGVSKQKVNALAQSYILNGFRRDPFWHDPLRAASPGPVVLRPADIDDIAFRREFYNSLNIFEEVTFCRQIEERRIYLSYYRERAKAHFKDDELKLLEACSNSVTSVLNKHAEIQRLLHSITARPKPLSRPQVLEKVNQAIRLEAPQLTRREAEICAGIVLGYTIRGLSMNCNISVNTVATHRRRAYAKLGINSQNELFAHYFGLAQRLSQEAQG